MTVTKADIDIWRSLPSETQKIEFKEAKVQIDSREICKYCTAIANEGGGHLILGVRNKPIPREIVGSKAIHDPVKETERLFSELSFRVEIEEVLHPEGRIVVFTIPSRPRGTAYKYDGRYWERIGQQLREMSSDTLRRIFAEGTPDWLEEYSKIDLTLDEVLNLLDYGYFFSRFELPLPTEKRSIVGRFVMERLVDERNYTYSIRRLCSILFARNLSDFPDISRKLVRVIVYNDSSKLNPRQERSFIRGYGVEFEPIVDFVMSQLPQNEVIERAVRREVRMVPELAVRELVANAMIHQDFQVQGATIMIEIFPNRLEISNPGMPIINVDRFIDGYQSRNGRLTDLMRLLGYCEARSSGIDKVINAAELYQLPAPEFRGDLIRTTAILYGQRSLDQMTGSDRVRACYQHCALKYVMRERMTNQTLRERFRLPEQKRSTISQIIQSAVQTGKIKIDERTTGSRKFARYLPYWA
ncbi:MAG: MloB [Calditrichaeota bacterium]|nr:MloB [Calditrichota bacterium]